MDAIRGNANAITQLASNLNCDFNALNNAICCVRSGIQEVAGNVNFVSKHGLHFTKALQEYASKQMVNSNNQEHTWTSEQVQNVCNVLNLKIPNTSTIEDVTYTANMAYADFYPELLNEHQCIKYAAAVANDKDGYTGIQFCRWVADVVGKKENIDWDKFK